MDIDGHRWTICWIWAYSIVHEKETVAEMCERMSFDFPPQVPVCVISFGRQTHHILLMHQRIFGKLTIFTRLYNQGFWSTWPLGHDTGRNNFHEMNPFSCREGKKNNNISSGWWFQPLWKILFKWDYIVPNICTSKFDLNVPFLPHLREPEIHFWGVLFLRGGPAVAIHLFHGYFPWYKASSYWGTSTSGPSSWASTCTFHKAGLVWKDHDSTSHMEVC